MVEGFHSGKHSWDSSVMHLGFLFDDSTGRMSKRMAGEDAGVKYLPLQPSERHMVATNASRRKRAGRPLTAGVSLQAWCLDVTCPMLLCPNQSGGLAVQHVSVTHRADGERLRKRSSRMIRLQRRASLPAQALCGPRNVYMYSTPIGLPTPSFTHPLVSPLLRALHQQSSFCDL